MPSPLDESQQPTHATQRVEVIPPTLAECVESVRESKWILAFMRSTPDCAILVRPGGAIVAVNDQAELVFGYTPEQLIGQSIETLVPRRFIPTHPRQVEGFFRAPQPIAIGVRKNLCGRHKDGREIPVEIGLTPIELGDGTLVLAMVRDISTRVHAAERLSLLIEAAPTAMIMVNRPGEIVLLNAKAEQMFGYTREELVGCPIEQLIPERFREKHPQLVAGFFANPVAREMGVGREVLGLRKDGSEFPAELALGSMEAEAETYVLATVVDISQRIRLARDLTAAREIQRSLLPHEPPQLFGFDIAGVCQPANETGGDFFDFIKLPNGNLVIVVGDVSGHGFGPAIRAATAQCSLRALLRTGMSLVEAVSGANTLMCEDYPGEQFVTLATLELIPQTGSFVFCGAGHDIYVFDNSGLIKHHLLAENPPLGIKAEEFQPSDRINLKPGELVLAVTDGVNEAHSPDHGLFGRERLFDLIKTCRRSRAQDIVHSVQTAINSFCEGAAQQDDITIVAIKVRE